MRGRNRNPIPHDLVPFCPFPLSTHQFRSSMGNTNWSHFGEMVMSYHVLSSYRRTSPSHTGRKYVKEEIFL